MGVVRERTVASIGVVSAPPAFPAVFMVLPLRPHGAIGPEQGDRSLLDTVPALEYRGQVLFTIKKDMHFLRVPTAGGEQKAKGKDPKHAEDDSASAVGEDIPPIGRIASVYGQGMVASRSRKRGIRCTPFSVVSMAAAPTRAPERMNSIRCSGREARSACR